MCYDCTIFIQTVLSKLQLINLCLKANHLSMQMTYSPDIIIIDA